MATDSERYQTSGSRRTYRGRTVAEILPRIRAELGPDAIILRERQGLEGGVGGFFAQRYVEIDAGPGDSELDAGPARHLAPVRGPAPVSTLAPASVPVPVREATESGGGRAPLRAVARSAPRPAAPRAKPFVPPVLKRERPKPATRHLDTTVFLERLREASAQLAQEDGSDTRDRADAPATQPSLSAPVAAPTEPPVSAPVAAPTEPPAAAPAVSAALAPRPAIPNSRRRPPRASEDSPTLVPARRAAAERSARSAAEHDRGLVQRLAELAGARRARRAEYTAAARPLDTAAAAAITARLEAHGAGQPWARALILRAGAHGTPLCPGGLESATAAELARRIVAAPPLPSTGAVIALVGAGGAGKTRCAAALASAYRRLSTLRVSLLAVDSPNGARELQGLLGPDAVPVLIGNGERAAQLVGDARRGGLVIVDTVAAAPTDPRAVGRLARQLSALAPDATYVTIPATLSGQAARRALASFATLHPAGIVITHADETDQLAVILEIATTHQIPLAYLHGGTDVHQALHAIEPAALAQQVLA